MGELQSSGAVSDRPDIGYIPTPAAMVTTLLYLARVGPTDVVYDLGCGDGRVLIAAAQRWGTLGVGIELDGALVAKARSQAIAANVAHLVEFRQGNLFDCDLHPATVVFLYLLPHLNLRLRPRLQAHLQPGSRIISRDFDLGDWPPTRTCTAVAEEEPATLYCWEL